MMRDIWLRVLQTGGARVYSMVVGLVILTITARWLGPSGRGEMAAALVWANVLVVVASMSLNAVTLHDATNSSVDGWLSRTLGTLLGYTAVTTVICWIICAALFFSPGRPLGTIRGSVWTIAALMIPLLLWEQFATALLASIDKLSIYNRSTVISKTLVVLLVALCIALHGGVRAAMAAMLAGQVAVAIVTIRGATSHSPHKPIFDRDLLRTFLRAGARLHPSAIALYLYSSSGVLILNRELGTTVTGHFQLSTQLIDVMLVLPYAAMLVLYAKTSQLGVTDVWAVQRRVLMGMTVVMVTGVLVGILAAPALLPLVAGRAFAPSVPIFQGVAVAAVFATISSVMTPQWIGRGMFGRLSLINVGSGALNLVLNLTVTPRLGVRGAVLATVVSYCATAAANLWMAFRCETEYRRELRRSTALTHE